MRIKGTLKVMIKEPIICGHKACFRHRIYHNKFILSQPKPNIRDAKLKTTFEINQKKNQKATMKKYRKFYQSNY